MSTPTITTMRELEQFVEGRRDDIEANRIFARWGNIERDAANGWISREWTDPDNPTELDGLCAADVYDADADVILGLADVWESEVQGDQFYLIDGRQCGECTDGYPLVEWVSPEAIIDVDAIRGEMT